MFSLFTWDTFCSTPKSSSRHYFFLPSKWVSFVISVPSKPRIVFSAQKPFYSQPNYSSKWLGNFLVLISSNIINCVPEHKQKQGSSWDSPFTYNNLIPVYQMEIQRPGATALTNWSSIYCTLTTFEPPPWRARICCWSSSFSLFSLWKSSAYMRTFKQCSNKNELNSWVRTGYTVFLRAIG